MKLRIIIPAFILFFTSCATYQVVSFSEPFVKVYEDLKGSKDELYIKANEWTIKIFNDAASVIQFTDKEEGVIMGKYLMSGEERSSAYTSIDTRVFAKIDIRVKDQKARISIEPLDKWNYDPYTVYKYSKENCIKDMESLSESLHKALLAQSVEF